jgi:multiple sugar transport system permease protein
LQWMFEPRYGVINHLLRVVFGISGPNWLRDMRTALPSFVLMSMWGVGGSMLINLAALQGVPTDLYDAASIDGAGAVRRFWNITIPMISPVIFFNLVMGIIGSLQSFDAFFILTRGGPNNATLTYMLYLYRHAFERHRMGYGSAMAWVLFIYISALTVAIFKWSGRWVYYESTI